MKTTPIKAQVQNLRAALRLCLPAACASAFPRRLLLVLALLAAAPGEAAPPGGGGGDTGGGAIYFMGPPASDTLNSASMNQMDSEGVVERQLGDWVRGTPSPGLRNGYRWFVTMIPIDGEDYPDGTPRWGELCIVRDDFHMLNNNTADTRIPLINDSTLAPMGADWGPGSDHISFIGRRWSSLEPGGTVIASGIYSVPLEFDQDGAIVGAAEQPTTPVIPFPLVETPSGTLRPDVDFFNWNQAATEVVYSSLDHGKLRLANLLGVHTTIRTGHMHTPTWTLSGDIILFADLYLGICTVKRNGTGFKVIIRNTLTWSFDFPRYSPMQNHLVFNGSLREGGRPHIFRASASGRNMVDLTGELEGGWGFFSFEGGWVEDLEH